MNNISKLLMASGLIASPWLVAACGGNSSDGGDGGESSGRSGICNSICERAEECGVGSMNECVQTCRNDDVSSSAALNVVEICADEVSCSGFGNGDLAECVTAGIADLDTSAAAEAYCDSLRAWAGECLSELPSTAECYGEANAASSGYLVDLEECLNEDCVDTIDCLEAVDTRYDIGDSIIQLATTGFGGPGGTACCATGDPCDWANDNVCDCSGEYAWDANDCAVEPTTCPWTNDGECDEPNVCPVGSDVADCSVNPDCCTSANSCEWEGDGICDCGGEFAWDAADCSSEPDCCTSANLCGYENDGICDCGGAYAWDANDCAADGDSCVWAFDGVCDEPEFCDYGTDTTDCAGTTGADSCVWAFDGICDEPEYCDYGTDTTDCSDELNCCATTDVCGWAGDGICDCGGAYAWDALDCGDPSGNSCVYAYDNFCDEPEYCDYGTDSSDCAGSCCSSGDPCGRAGDDICDCDGVFSWDAVDCSL